MSSIDVAIPNYNYGKYLKDCVASVQAQGIEGYRILIIDNASTDNSQAIARELAAQDPRIELLLRTENAGFHASFNAGIDWAEAEHFFLLHSDDCCAPGSLQRAIGVMNRHPDVVLTYGRTGYVIGDNSPSEELDESVSGWTIDSGDAFIESRCRMAINGIGCSTAIVRTAAQKQGGDYNKNLMIAPDMELWLRLAKLGDVASTKSTQGITRLHDSNISLHMRDKLSRQLVGMIEAFNTFFEAETAKGNDVDRLRAMFMKSVSERAYWAAWAHLCRGHPAGALELAGMALKGRPSCLLLPPVQYLFRREGASERMVQALVDLKDAIFTSIRRPGAQKSK